MTVPGSSFMRRPEDPSWIRYAILVGCCPTGPDFDTRAARTRFLAFLDEPLVSNLVSALTTVPDDAVWSKRAAHDSAFDAVLTKASDNDAVASARFELPDGTQRFGRDTRRAALIIHFEASRCGTSRAQADWVEWTDRITRVLRAVPSVADFLSGRLGLEVLADPPPQVAVRLETPKDLAQLIGTSGLDPLPGKQHLRQAIGFFTAFPDGASPGDAAEQMIQHVLRVSLNMDI